MSIGCPIFVHGRPDESWTTNDRLMDIYLDVRFTYMKVEWMSTNCYPMDIRFRKPSVCPIGTHGSPDEFWATNGSTLTVV